MELRILRHDDDLRSPADEPSPTQCSLQTDGSLRSAATLTRIGAYEEAHAILDAAIVSARDALDRRALARALLASAQTAALSGVADPHPLIDEARQIGRELRDGELLARCSLVRFGSGIPTDKSAALIELTEPLDLLPLSAPEQIDLLCAAAVLVIFIDASDAADRLMAAAERLHEAAPTTRSEVVWLTARSLVGAVRGTDPGHVDEWSARALELARGAPVEPTWLSCRSKRGCARSTVPVASPRSTSCSTSSTSPRGGVAVVRDGAGHAVPGDQRAGAG